MKVKYFIGALDWKIIRDEGETLSVENLDV